MPMKMRRSFLAVTALFAVFCSAAENPLLEMFGDSVTLFVPFDDGTCAPAAGELTPLAAQTGGVIEPGGIFGKRLAAGSVRFALDRAGRETLDTTVPGTVLCWVRAEYVPPKTGLEPAMIFFTAQSKDAKRKLYGMKRGGTKWGWGPVETFYEVFTTRGGRTVCYASRDLPMTRWTPGRWYLTAMTWTPEMIGFSLDGGPFTFASYRNALGSFDGSFGWLAPSVAQGVGKRLYSIDDCAVLNRAIKDDEIRCYYEAATAVSAGRPNPHPIAKNVRRRATAADFVGFRFAYYPGYDKIHVKVTASALMRKTAAKGNFRLTIRPADGEALATYRIKTGEGGVYEAVLDVPDLAARTKNAGKPDYEAVLEATDLADCRLVRPFRRSVFEWERTSLGRSGAIPEPYTPISVDTRAPGELVVGTRCKRHRLDGLGLWRDVTVDMTAAEYGAASAPKGPFGVMSGPMRLETVTGGRTETVSGTGVEIAARSPDRLSLTAAFAGTLSGRVASEWEMDGMMTWTLTLTGGEADTLRLVIPLDGRAVSLMQACADGVRINTGGGIPAGTGRVWDGSKARRNKIIGDYVPYLWVGGPVAGISVFGDNDRGWVTGGAPCQEIVRRADGTVDVVLNLVSRPTKITSPRTMRIGFLATPVKPMEENWRATDFGELIGSCYGWGAHVTALDFQTFDPSDTYWKEMAKAREKGEIDYAFITSYVASAPSRGEPGSRQDLDYRELLRKEFAAGMRRARGAGKRPVVFYTNGRGIATGVEPGRTFIDEWMLGAFQVRSSSRFSGAPYSMDPAPSLVDYQLSCFRRMLDSGACDRLYWDDVFLAPNFSPVGTDAYETPEGMQPSCGVFRMREQVKRTAIMQKELGYDPRHNWIHMTDTPIAPISAFAGVHYDLEDAREATSLQQRYSRERLLAGSLGRQFGVPVATMAYYLRRKDGRTAEIERSNIGVSLTFEFWWRRGPDMYHALYRKLRAWGYGEKGLAVWNWWDAPRYPVTIKGIESSSIVMSKGGRGLFIVSNWGGGEKVRAAFDVKTLGIAPGAVVTDFETGAPLVLTDAALEFTVAKGDFRIIEWRNAK